jgi:hypothetical protein
MRKQLPGRARGAVAIRTIRLLKAALPEKQKDTHGCCAVVFRQYLGQ